MEDVREEEAEEEILEEEEEVYVREEFGTITGLKVGHQNKKWEELSVEPD